MMEKPIPDINSQTVQNYLQDYFLSKKMIQATKTGYSFLYDCVFGLAEFFDCKKEMAELEEIYFGCKPGERGYRLPALDDACFESMINQDPTTTTFNFQYKPKRDANAPIEEPIFSLGILRSMLAERTGKISRIFNRICRKYDIPQKFNMGLLDANAVLGMPRLK